jgi:apolipoprotein D and lipocalin family protein
MRRLTALVLLALSACAAPPPPAPGLRDPGATIASAALFDPARFADVWHIVAAYGAEAGCGPLAETWVLTGAGSYAVTGTACGPDGARAFAGRAAITGPGRILREGLNGSEEIWVLWVDQDYRVAAIGTPDGRFGRILSRSPKVRPDLLAAAREVLDFNGYDTGRLGLIGG